MPQPNAVRLDPELVLPATLLSRYLFFLGRRPISGANAHYRDSRIGALQSLARLFEDAGIREPLRALTPSNFARVAPQLQRVLQPQLAYRLPRDLVNGADAPAREAWSAMQRMVVIYGPAIGIGDEIVSASIPRVLQTLAPRATIDVLTAYDGLWERIAPEQRVKRYADLAELLQRIRSGADDAVVYIDFEPPGLIAAMAHEPQVRRFLELSVGTRSLVLLDNVERSLRTMPASLAQQENFYDCLRAMGRWLGVGSGPIGGNVRERKTSPRRIVVSPFTSKEEPSERVWSTLLATMLSRVDDVQVVLDTGPNPATRAFAIALRDGLRASGTRTQLAASTRSATLGEMLDLVRDADLVVSADSYLAHASPRFGVPTLVVAREGLEPWRVPAPRSFYFRTDLGAEAIGEAMQLFLREPRIAPQHSLEARELRAAAAAIDFNAPLAQLRDAWRQCFDAHNALVAAWADWPRPFATLAADQRYGRLMPRWPDAATVSEEELRAHLAMRFAECASSNLWKYVREEV